MNVTEAFQAAYNKLKNKAAFEAALKDATFVTDDAGKYIVDEHGNYLAEVLVDGQKIPVLIGEEQALKRIDNAVQELETLLTKEGRFIEDALENDYQNYLARKLKEGKPPRERLDWKEARDYWLYDSPLARGNAFNDKAKVEEWYPYNEVTLANGKRVDSYDLLKGDIVSRKATNLEEIALSTFESYLKEMKTKYFPGEPINAPKYGNELKGKVLEGKQILEIPSSNQNFNQMQEYINLAKNKYNIEIRFRPE